MRAEELTHTSRHDLAKGDRCVMVAPSDDDAGTRRCLESLLANTPQDVPIAAVLTAPLDPESELGRLLNEPLDGERRLWLIHPQRDSPNDGPRTPAPRDDGPPGNATTAVVDRALALLQPADVALLRQPCRVTDGWLERMGDAARADSNTATASALADIGTPLALRERDDPAEDLEQMSDTLAAHTLRLRPRLRGAVGPCVYIRREALELVGGLDEGLDLHWALEVDFAQRCLLSGLAHVAADDVVVQRIAPASHSRGGAPAHARRTLSIAARAPRARRLGRAHARARGGARATGADGRDDRRARARRRRDRYAGAHPRADPRARAQRERCELRLLVRAPSGSTPRRSSCCARCRAPRSSPPKRSRRRRRGAPSSTARSRPSRRGTSRWR